MKRRQVEEEEGEHGMPEHLRVFRREDWPASDAMTACIHWTYARAAWRRAHGLPVWQPRVAVDR